jgi:hypothetical protein
MSSEVRLERSQRFPDSLDVCGGTLIDDVEIIRKAGRSVKGSRYAADDDE